MSAISGHCRWTVAVKFEMSSRSVVFLAFAASLTFASPGEDTTTATQGNLVHNSRLSSQHRRQFVGVLVVEGNRIMPCRDEDCSLHVVSVNSAV